MKKGKYLITGCAGFIGSHLVKKISDKYNLILIDDLSRGSLKNISKKLRKKIIKKKIQDLDELKIKNNSFVLFLWLNKMIVGIKKIVKVNKLNVYVPIKDRICKKLK